MNYRLSKNDKFDDLLITQPNQAFTPRQILEQFARNEVVPTFNQSSDSLDDSNYSDDQLLDSELHEFDDSMEAETYLNENQFQLQNETETSNNVREGSQEGANETTQGVESPTV